MKIDWNMKGFQELRTDPAIMAVIEDEANKIAERAGAGFEVQGPKRTGGRIRGHARVVTATPAAMEKNAIENTLLNALGGGE